MSWASLKVAEARKNPNDAQGMKILGVDPGVHGGLAIRRDHRPRRAAAETWPHGQSGFAMRERRCMSSTRRSLVSEPMAPRSPKSVARNLIHHSQLASVGDALLLLLGHPKTTAQTYRFVE
jgi:hypothetical protein